MELPDAIELIKNQHISRQNNAKWADLGCGSGLFTFALAHLLKANCTIYAVDKNPANFDALLQPPGIHIQSMQLDFVADALPLQDLNGILMANSLHYVRDKPALISKLANCLKPDGNFLIVEYDTDTPVRHWDKAKAVYEAYLKNETDSAAAKKILLQDWDALEKAGVTHKDMEKARAWVRG